MSKFSSIFHDKLIPWTQENLPQRLIIARPKMSKMEMPFGVELTRQKIIGKRYLVRTRMDGTQKIVRARWPEAGLHETYSSKLVCVLKGRTDYRVGEYIITCSTGKFILLPPFIPNTIGGRSHLEGESRKWGSCDLLQLILERDQVSFAYCFSRGEEHREGERYIISDPLTVNLFRLFVDEARKKQKDEMLTSYLLAASFLLMQREIRESHYASSALAKYSSKSTFDDNLLQQIHAYIKTNLKQSLTIEKVAQAMYTSPSQFTRFLRQKANKSFVEILTEHRIEESKRLLRETRWSITAISMQMGFKSAPYFTLFFTKNVGISPSAYRDNKND